MKENAGEVETSVAQVGLRDFLFYVVPGAVLLIGILAFLGVVARDLQPYLDISSSIAGILISYLLGQFAYPAAYLFRAIMGKIGRLRKLSNEECDDFRRAYRKLANESQTYFAVEVFRYRTMARFCSVMVFPVLFVTAGSLWGRWQLGLETKGAIVIAASLVCMGLLLRYTTAMSADSAQQYVTLQNQMPRRTGCLTACAYKKGNEKCRDGRDRTIRKLSLLASLPVGVGDHHWRP